MIIKKVSAVIVLYNEFKMVRECIKTIYAQNFNKQDLEIILVDNNSEKSGFEKLKSEYKDILFIRNKNNLGYAAAVNIGFLKSRSKYVFAITPDSRLLPKTLKKTVDYLEKNPDVAVVGCKIYSLPKVLNQSAFHAFPNLLSNLFEYNMLFFKLSHKINPLFNPLMYSLKDHKKEIYAKHMIGAFLLIDREIGKKIGFNDKRFFMYREETDFCKRLINSGYKIMYLPTDGLLHVGGAPWKTTKITQCMPYYMKSNYLFFKIHYGNLYAWLALIEGILSIAISIPFLATVSFYKKLIHQSSQSKELLPLWIKSFYWHVIEGPRVLLTK